MALLSSQRHLFDVPDDVAYFNAAYYTPQLNQSTERLIAAAQVKRHPWERFAPSFFEDPETLRRLAASLFGGDADGYAVVPAASYGLSAAARVIEPHLKAGDQILVIAEEFPSNVLPWRAAAQEKGASLVTVPAPEDGDWTKAILAAIDERVKVVAVSTCHWTNGAFIDLARISERCRAASIPLVVDVTQTLGAMPFSVDDIKPDFVVAAGYKWLLGPYGCALMYVGERWRDSRPLEESWLSRLNAEDFTSLVRYSETYMPGARRFDGGEKATTLLPGFIAALEQIQSWGVANIAESLAAINARIAERLKQLGFQLPPDAQRCPHMFGARLPETYQGSLVAELRKRNIHISQRGNSLRFAPHVHVNDHDVNRLIDALSELVT